MIDFHIGERKGLFSCGCPSEGGTRRWSAEAVTEEERWKTWDIKEYIRRWKGKKKKNKIKGCWTSHSSAYSTYTTIGVDRQHCAVFFVFCFERVIDATTAIIYKDCGRRARAPANRESSYNMRGRTCEKRNRLKCFIIIPANCSTIYGAL